MFPHTGCSDMVPLSKLRLCIQSVFSLLRVLWMEARKCWRSHEGVLCRRPVGEAWESSGGFLDAAGDGQRVGAQRGGHGQVGELWVKVSQVRGTRLSNQAGRMGY